MRKVIVLGGLGDHVDYLRWATRSWNRIGLQPIIHSMDWRNEETFEAKLQTLSALVDEHSKSGDKISVAGYSAGGSAALNLFAVRNDTLENAVSICGRLRQGTGAGFRTFESRTKTSPSFAESVRLFEKQEITLTENQRKRIMTIHARFGDELVPRETATLKGARNIALSSIGHSLTIFLSLNCFSKTIVDFLQN